MQEAMDKPRAVHDELSKKLDAVARADQLQQQTLPWQHFIKELDNLISKQDGNSTASSEKSSKVAKPSARAVFLTEQTTTGLPTDAQLRAYRIDHALLTTHVSMLQKEIERYEKLVESQEDVGKFLTDHDVWSILKKTLASSSTTTSGSTLGTTFTRGSA